MFSRALATRLERQEENWEAQKGVARPIVEECAKTCVFEERDGKPRFLVFYVRLATIRERFEPHLAIGFRMESWKDAAACIRQVVEEELRKDPALEFLGSYAPRLRKREILGTDEDVVEFQYELKSIPVARVAEKSGGGGDGGDEVAMATVVE